MPPQPIDNWRAFEDVVAEIFVSTGAAVKRNVNIAGNQIDVQIEEATPSGQRIRTAVECKYFHERVPKSAVLQFATVATFLRQAGLIDKAAIVGYHGFSQAARTAAETAGITLIEFRDLELRLASAPPSILNRFGIPSGSPTAWQAALLEIVRQAESRPKPTAFPDTAFIAMPFSEELEDLYIYGIRTSAEKNSLKCKRADEIEHAGPIMDEIIDNIRRCRVVIAEITDRNPNVYYEVGYAHALERPTILIARETAELPFDVSHINVILYKNIHDLESRLTKRLETLLHSG